MHKKGATWPLLTSLDHTYMHICKKENRISMDIRGDFVNIMCQVNQEYDKHVRYEKGERGFVSISAQRDLWLHIVCIFVV